METKFNFKSQVCTSVEQSRRLLELGLKKETADMHHYRWSEGYWDIQACPPRGDSSSFIPAWSLHRLIEMIPEEMHGGLLCVFKDSIRYEEVIMDRLEAHFEVAVCSALIIFGYYMGSNSKKD